MDPSSHAPAPSSAMAAANTAAVAAHTIAHQPYHAPLPTFLDGRVEETFGLDDIMGPQMRSACLEPYDMEEEPVMRSACEIGASADGEHCRGGFDCDALFSSSARLVRDDPTVPPQIPALWSLCQTSIRVADHIHAFADAVRAIETVAATTLGVVCDLEPNKKKWKVKGVVHKGFNRCEFRVNVFASPRGDGGAVLEFQRRSGDSLTWLHFYRACAALLEPRASSEKCAEMPMGLMHAPPVPEAVLRRFSSEGFSSAAVLVTLGSKEPTGFATGPASVYPARNPRCDIAQQLRFASEALSAPAGMGLRVDGARMAADVVCGVFAESKGDDHALLTELERSDVLSGLCRTLVSTRDEEAAAAATALAQICVRFSTIQSAKQNWIALLRFASDALMATDDSYTAGQTRRQIVHMLHELSATYAQEMSCLDIGRVIEPTVHSLDAHTSDLARRTLMRLQRSAVLVR